jgi:hypothetical protein
MTITPIHSNAPQADREGGPPYTQKPDCIIRRSPTVKEGQMQTSSKTLRMDRNDAPVKRNAVENSRRLERLENPALTAGFSWYILAA